jgi:hypothetical protein
MNRITLKVFFFKSSSPEPILIKLGTQRPWLMVIQIWSDKGPSTFQRGYTCTCNYKNAKNKICVILKSSQEPLSQKYLDLHKSFLT